MTNTTAVAARITRPVTFGLGTRYEVTFGAGSVLEVVSFGAEQVRVQFGRRTALVSMDDATPVEWDEDEQMWVEA